MTEFIEAIYCKLSENGIKVEFTAAGHLEVITVTPHGTSIHMDTLLWAEKWFRDMFEQDLRFLPF